MHNNYDAIARWYDGLSRMVFGKAQVHAQTILLPYLPEKGRVLIAGGGTGWILEEIAKIRPAGLHITYVELSANMLDLSRQRDVKGNQVDFVHAAIENFRPETTYDTIFTAFLFDNFKADKANAVFGLLHACLARSGNWLFVDFQYKKGKRTWWQGLLLRSMLLFFKVVSHIEADKLVAMEPEFKRYGYTKVFEATACKGFISAAAYAAPAVV